LLPNVGGSKKVDDFILKPDGSLIETSPQDFIFGRKNPGAMGGVTVNIGTVMGMNPTDISRALSRELSNKLSL